MLNVVLDHQDFIVVNKPPGIAVHAHGETTLLQQVRLQLCSDDIHPVHRLDMPTSGLVIFAKTAAANRYFCETFAQQKVQKLYVALSAAKVKKKRGWIIGDMASARNGNFKLLRSHKNPAVTYGISFGVHGQYRLWCLRPTTGKTHQLRVALKSMGAPILGDSRYGGQNADRLYLHAWRLKFTYNDEHYCLHALPEAGDKFRQLIDNGSLHDLGDPWLLDWPKTLSDDSPSGSITPNE